MATVPIRLKWIGKLMTIQTKLCDMSGLDAGHTHAAFELQLCYGLKLLFSNYESVEDFVVLFEFHDDLAMIMGSEEPTEIKFYQLKSYANDLTLTSLLKKITSKKSKNNKVATKKDSVIEKLYFNLDKFGDLATSADVVSATHCKSTKTSDTILHKARFTFDELSPDDQQVVIDLLKARYGASKISQTSLERVGYTKVQMSKEEHLQIVKGSVHDFLLSVTGTDEQPLESLTATIKEICRRKQMRKTADVSPIYSEAIKQKGVSKSELNEWITTAKNYRKCPPWAEISADIHTLSLTEKLQIRNSFEEYKTQVLNSGNTIIEKLKHAIKKEITLNPIDASETLEDVVDRVSQSLVGQLDHPVTKIKAAVIYEIYTKK